MASKNKSTFDEIFEKLSWAQPLSKKDIKNVYELAKKEGFNQAVDSILSKQKGRAVNGSFESIVLVKDIEEIKEKNNQ